MILEAMKMEIPIVSPFDGTIETILAAEGDSVEAGQPVAVVACEGKASYSLTGEENGIRCKYH